MAAPASKVEVCLSPQQRAALGRLVRTGTHTAHARRRASVLLHADAAGPDGWSDDRIAQALDINRMTASRVRARFAREGLDATLHKKKARGRQHRKLDGAQEARLVALACSAPPEGHARWTMKLLAGRLVELEVVAPVDASTVWRALQKTNSSRG